MAPKDKPYRIYRGGRVKGPIRPESPKSDRRADRDKANGPGPRDYRGPRPARTRRRRVRPVVWTLVLVLVLVLVWAVLGFLAFRSGVKEANKKLDPRAERALTPQDGIMLSNPSNILVLGADNGSKSRQGDVARSDSIMIVHTDPDEHRIALLSIPRDLRVDIPGHGEDKINAAFAYGGPTLAIKTVQSVTGLPINHVVVVDFGTFDEVIDALGGVSIDVPKPILSNKFECPRATQAACDRWKGWRFKKGEQTMDGKHALIYARVRENQLNPNESDITRGERQQAVVSAMADKIVSFTEYLKAPFNGDDIVKPLATDLSAAQILELGWIKFRTPSSGKLKCRLGGTASNLGGVDYIVGTEENVSVIAMVTGKSAPQPPKPASGPYGPGCIIGG
ncbi:MAG TPA: LCP family protein [Gaiellaceae bacterium]|nr:LCP family protein [Gaiellaceae bacterium]